MNANPYDQSFYAINKVGSSRSAAGVVPLVVELVSPRSVVDVGCGTGTWLAQFRQAGCQTLGFDGDYVDRAMLQIPRDEFIPKNLEQPVKVDRRFDLATCLEVAEHLTPERAPGLVADLIALSDCVLFSAAVVGQGGANHINERPVSYWAALFQERGYVGADVIRPRIWDRDNVDWWYRQNMVIFAKEGHPILKGAPPVTDLLHPGLHEDLYLRAFRPTLSRLLRAIPGSLMRSVRSRLLGKPSPTDVIYAGRNLN